MASTIKVDKIEGSTGSTVTVPTGQTFTITDGISGTGANLTALNATQITSGTIPSADRLPTVTVAKGGTNLSSFSAGDVLYATGATTLAKLAKPGTPAGEVLTFATSASAPSWVAPAGGGKVLNVIGITNSTRTTLTTSAAADFISTTYTQIQADSKIGVVAVMSGFSNSSGGANLNLTYDTTEYLGVGAWQYVTAANQKIASFCAYFDGASTTGSKTFKLSYGVENVDTARPFVVWNPNSSDDARLAQTKTTIIITEYDM